MLHFFCELFVNLPPPPIQSPILETGPSTPYGPTLAGVTHFLDIVDFKTDPDTVCVLGYEP